MANQQDRVTLTPTPTNDGGTGFTLTFHLTGGDVTTAPIHYDATLMQVQSAVNVVLTGGQIITVGGSIAAGLTFLYGGTLGNTFFTTMGCDASALTALASVGSLTVKFASTATQATMVYTFTGGSMSAQPQLGTYTLDGTTGIACTAAPPNGAFSWTGSPQSGTLTGTSLAYGAGQSAPSDANFSNLTFSDGITSFDGTITPTFTDGVNGAHPSTVFAYYQAATTSGGTFALAHTGSGSDVTGIAFDATTNDMATDLSTATGLTFAFTSGAGTSASPWLFTCSTFGPVTVPTPDWSGLTQGVTATPTTPTSGSSDSGAGLTGLSAMSGRSAMTGACG